jgi:hypothetical protein
MTHVAMKTFTVHASWDAEAGVWYAKNDQLPLTTEAPDLTQLMARIMEMAPEIAELNGLVKIGEQVKIHLTADQVAIVTG